MFGGGWSCCRRGCVGLLVLLSDLGLLKVGLLVLVPTWVCGFVGSVAGFGSVEGGSVGGVASVSVWVYWWCCRRGCVGLLLPWVCGSVGGADGVVC